MRKPALITIIFVVALFLLAACSQQNGNTSNGGGSGSSQITLIPTIPATPTATLPATYTPIVHGHAGHLYGISGGGNIMTMATQAVHVVQRGETLGLIANRYMVPVQAIAIRNHITNYDHIEVGDVLLIPACE